MGKLNYSKWDQLELSDDSDVEVHPNVDKKSFIRWKQRDIHEKREERKRKIAFLHSEIELNNTLLPRLDELITHVSDEGTDYFERKTAELAAIKDRPDAPRPNTGNPNQPSYDDMMHALMNTVADEVKESHPDSIKDKITRSKALEETLKTHRRQLVERTEQCKKDVEKEEAEAKKHITSEDIHEGWSAGSVNKNAASAQVVDPVDSSSSSHAAKAKKVKGKAKEIEVLNPKSSGSQADVVPASSGYAPDTEGQSAPSAAPASAITASDDDEDDEDEDEEDVPAMTESAKRFVQIQPGNWELAYRAISSDPSLLKEEIDDAILVEAFEQAMKGKRKEAMACVHASKILQYCRKLGKDGVALFFKRMSTNKDALRVFEDDVKQTWDRIDKRSKELAAERAAAGVNESGEREQIQLVAQDPSTTITFEVPDGPPPEEIKLEGEGSDQMDPEKVREFLQKRWDIYQSFPKNLRKALEKKDLEEVNRVLGRMSVEQGEETVGLLDEAGILSFSSTDIVDKTVEQRG